MPPHGLLGIVSVRFFDRQDDANPHNGSLAGDGPEVLALLDAHRHRTPFFSELVGSDGFNLLVGLGGPTGCVQHSAASGAPPYLMAVRRAPDSAAPGAEFLMGGTATPIAARFCLPFDTVQEIVAYFVETGLLSPALSWEEI
jgi:Immunity protein Imm1